jgi:hypothetical protein
MGLFWEISPRGSVKAYGVHENLLLNGGFDTDQVNGGTLYTNPTNGSATLDAWLAFKSGATPPSFTVNRAATGDIGAQVDVGNYAMKVVVTNIGVGSGALSISQAVINPLNYKGQTVSLSVRVYSSLANVVRVGIDDGISVSYSGYHPGGASYQTLNITKVMSASATTLNILVFYSTQTDLQTGTYFIGSSMLVVGDFPVPYRQRFTDFNIDGTRIKAGSINQDRINSASYAGSGIGFNQTGTVQVFYMAAPPSGWTQVVSMNDRALRVVNGAGGGTGGSSALSAGFALSHSHTVNSHSHTVNSHAHTVNSHSHGISADGSHSHTINSHTHPITQSAIDHKHATHVLRANVAGSDTHVVAGNPSPPWGYSGDIVATGTNVMIFGGGSPLGVLSQPFQYFLSNAINTGSYAGGSTSVQASTGTDTQGSHTHGAATGNATPATDSQAPGTSSQAPGTDSILGTFTFQYLDVIVAQKN